MIDQNDYFEVGKIDKYYVILTCLFVTTVITSLTMGYKVINIGPLVVTGTVFIYPLTFPLGDLISELYGYKWARYTIVLSLVCELFFSVATNLINVLPSHEHLGFSRAYTTIIPWFLRGYLSDVITIYISGTINTYVISKWRVLVKGKYFWMRSLGSSNVGLIIAAVIATCISFSGVLNFYNLLNVMLSCIIVNEVFIMSLIFPTIIVLLFLKKLRAKDISSMYAYNPFRL